MGWGLRAAGAEPGLSPQNSTLTIEEFHAKLQEATNFPLRPFVIPFLKVGALHGPRVHKSPPPRAVPSGRGARGAVCNNAQG